MPLRVSILLVSYLVLIACLAFFAGRTDAAHEHLWAFRHIAAYHWLFWALALCAAAAPVLRRCATSSEESANRLARRRFRPGFATALGIWSIATLAAVSLLYVFRQRLFLAPPEGMGDSLLILEQVPVYSHLRGYLDSFDELLELYWHCKLYLFGAARYGWHAEDAYALLSIGAFAAYGAALFLFLYRRTLIEILYGVALLLCVPALQLYAGYVEHYTLATTALSFCILIGASVLESRASTAEASGGELPARDSPERTTKDVWPIAALALCAALAVLHHSISVVILPALVYFVWQLAGGRRAAMLRLAAWAAAVALPVLLGVWTYFLVFAEPPLAFFDSHVSSPPVHRPGGLLKPEHLRDTLNLFFLASPAGALILATAIALPAANLRSTVQRFLLLATAGLAGITFVIKSLIGFPADWDLLTMYQFPLNLFCFYLIGHWRRTGRLSGVSDWGLLAVVLAINASVSCAWIGRNAQQSVTSQRNVAQARENVRTSLRIIRADPVFHRVQAERQKVYIQVKLFFIRSRNRLQNGGGDFAPATRKELLKTLDAAEAKFSDWMLLPDEEHGARYAPLWKEFSELNVRINASGN